MTRSIGRLAMPGLGLLALLGGCTESREPPCFEVVDGPADLQLHLGLGGVLVDQSWNSLSLTLQNRGGPFQGTLRVRGLRLGGASGLVRDRHTYRIDLEIPGLGGAPREVAFPAWVSEWVAVEVVLEEPGFRSRHVLDLPALLRPPGWHALWVGPPERGSRGLLGRPAEEGEEPAALERFVVGHATPGELSHLHGAYEPFSLIVLDGTTLSGIDPRILEALRRWVERGGVLVALPGLEWASGVPEALRDLLGLARVAVEEGVPPGLPGGASEPGARGLAVTLAPRDGASILEDPWALRVRCGLGEVATLRWAPRAGGIPEGPEAPGFRDALARLSGRADWAGDPRTCDLMEEFAASAIQRLAAQSLPSRAALVRAAALYILVGLILPGLILGRLRRREWAFAVLTVAAVAATLAIYRFGALIERSAAEVEEITLIRLGADGEAGDATSFLGLTAPRGRTVGLPWDDRGGLPRLIDPARFALRSPASTGRGAGLLDLEVRVDRSGRLHVETLRLPPRALVPIRVDVMARLPASVRLDFPEIDGPPAFAFFVPPLPLSTARELDYDLARVPPWGRVELLTARGEQRRTRNRWDASSGAGLGGERWGSLDAAYWTTVVLGEALLSGARRHRATHPDQDAGLPARMVISVPETTFPDIDGAPARRGCTVILKELVDW